MLEIVGSVVVGLLASTWIGAIVFGRWMPRISRKMLVDTVLSGARADRWSHVTSVILLAGLDQTLGRPTRGSCHILRITTSIVAFLLIALSITGLYSKTFLGFRESPWHGYDKTIDMLHKAYTRQDPQLQDEQYKAVSARLVTAKATHWKYIYVAFAIPITLLLYVVAFFLSAKAVRYLILEIIGARTWIQKAGIACLASIALVMWAATLVLVFSFFSSPFPILTLSLVHLASTVWILTGALALALFEFFLSDPWFKALLLASILPGAAFLLAILLPLAVDLGTELYAGTKKRVATVAYEHLGPTFIPLCMTLAAVSCIFIFLKVIL